MATTGEKLWRYASLARLWSWTLIGVSAALLALSVAIQAGTAQGVDQRWLSAALGITGLTGVVSYPLFRVWLRKTALPSVRLPQAVRASGPRRLEATPRDWRRWAGLTAAVLLIGGTAMLVFLVGVLGRGGTAEGVVVGMLAAWGAATLTDVRRIEEAERAEGRRYYAACRRPTGVGNRLVWLPRRTAGAAAGAARPL